MARTGSTPSPRDGSVRITTARSSHSEEIQGRQRRYLISMGIRTACFVLAVVTDGVLRWIFIIAAFVLPYVAVVVANAGAVLDHDAPEPFVDDSRPKLPPGAADDAEQNVKEPRDGTSNNHP